jgi:hypothetical protein
MNILRLTLAALTFAAANVSAAEHPAALSQVSVNAGARLVVDCSVQRLPSLRAVGAVLDSNNASLLYAQRERLTHSAHRECMRGAASVAFVRDDDARTPALAMAGAAANP